jgi:hypothetical protein
MSRLKYDRCEGDQMMGIAVGGRRFGQGCWSKWLAVEGSLKFEFAFVENDGI